MASPQLENGFTRIANELLEALCRTSLSGQRMRIALHVIRESYGRRSKTAQFTYGEGAKALGIARQHFVREMTWLTEHGYLSKTEGEHDRDTPTWSFQKDHTRWGSTEIGTTDNQEDQRKPEKSELIGSPEIGSTEIGTSPEMGSKGATEIGSPQTPLKEKEKKKDVRTSLQPLPEAAKLLRSIGFTENQALTAASSRPDIPKVFPRIKQWLETSTAQKPIAVLWRCLERGELPGDLPAEKPFDPRAHFLPENGPKNYKGYNDWIAAHPGYYQGGY